MQCRCPFPDCKAEFEDSGLQTFQKAFCPACGRILSARTLERARAIDVVVEKHFKLGSLSYQNAPPDPVSESLVVLLEDIRSLWNVGSIFRTADGSGFARLILTGITGYPPRNEIAKTSLGAENHVTWSYSGAAVEVIPDLRRAGYQIVALENTGASRNLTAALDENLLSAPLVLLLGNEVTGLYLDTLSLADVTVDLPMRGFKNSLNVAVAFGIASYAIAQRFFRHPGETMS